MVYEGDTAEALAQEFTDKHSKTSLNSDNSIIDDNLQSKLVILLQDQIAGLLARIDEELTSNNSEQLENQLQA